MYRLIPAFHLSLGGFLLVTSTLAPLFPPHQYRILVLALVRFPPLHRSVSSFASRWSASTSPSRVFITAILASASWYHRGDHPSSSRKIEVAHSSCVLTTTSCDAPSPITALEDVSSQRDGVRGVHRYSPSTRPTSSLMHHRSIMMLSLIHSIVHHLFTIICV